MDGPEILAALKGRWPVRLAVVCGRTGLSRDAERECRKNWLVKGVDFEEVGHELRYAAAGLDKLAGRLGAEAQKNGALASAGGRGATLGGPVALDEGDGGALVLAAAGAKKEPLLLTAVAETWAPQRVTVRRADFMNRQVIECVVGDFSKKRAALDEAGLARVTVRVKSAENFTVGLVVWARPEFGQSAWVFLGGGPEPAEGARCPRFRGKF